MRITTAGARVPGTRIGDYIVEAADEAGYTAVHVLLPRRARIRVGSPGDVRPMREACILEALRIPGVPRVFEVGVLVEPAPEAGTTLPSPGPRPWIAQEIVEGASMLALGKAAGRLSPREVLTMLREIGQVLAYAHLRGVAHRAVRPDAIVRGDRSRGHALCLTNWTEALAIQGERDGARACADDVFALGLVADLLLGARASAPPKLAALVDDMLTPDPGERPQAAEVCARANVMLEGIETLDEDIVEEQVVLVDLIPRTKTPPPLPPLPPRVRSRWTADVRFARSSSEMAATTEPAGIAIAQLKPRSP